MLSNTQCIKAASFSGCTTSRMGIHRSVSHGISATSLQWLLPPTSVQEVGLLGGCNNHCPCCISGEEPQGWSIIVANNFCRISQFRVLSAEISQPQQAVVSGSRAREWSHMYFGEFGKNGSRTNGWRLGMAWILYYYRLSTFLLPCLACFDRPVRLFIHHHCSSLAGYWQCINISSDKIASSSSPAEPPKHQTASLPLLPRATLSSSA